MIKDASDSSAHENVYTKVFLRFFFVVIPRPLLKYSRYIGVNLTAVKSVMPNWECEGIGVSGEGEYMLGTLMFGEVILK